MKPRVTIGMCGMNCQNTVAAALESVAKQDFSHELMEIVFVDDGSRDNTLSVVKNYLSKMDIASKVFSGEWRGLGKSRNTIIFNASGDYILWVDTDEIFSEDFLRKQMYTIEKNPKAGIVLGKLGILNQHNYVLVLDLIPSIVEHSRQDWKGPKLPGTGGATYRVVAARQVGGFDERISGTGEDMDIAFRIREAGWEIIEGEGVFYEEHGKLCTWISLLRRSANQGRDLRRLHRRTGRFSSFLKMNPLASFVAGVLYAVNGYKATRRKIVLFLPIHFNLKMLAWYWGFYKG